MTRLICHTRSFWFLAVIACLIITGCKEDPKENYLFSTPAAEDSGLEFINTLVETDALNILDYLYFYNGGGVAIGDINNDGLPDIYLTGNQVPNKLLLNKGNMQFEDITEGAGVAGKSNWNTGVTMADVNGDGFLDIYICAVVGINGLRGKNELFINNGDNTFTEEGEMYGLDLKNYSSSAAFFDYDNDGDLDMYLLNHAVHTVNTYGPAEIRNNRTVESGDKLFRNDNGKFVDVSEEAGIFGGANGYGLGLATADFNNDGYTDIYVSNDFHEDDYYYLNNGNGTFTEVLKEKFTHVSRFSMGSDVADVNNDGYMDILTLDMLPEDEKVLKASMGDDPLDLHNMKINRLNYHQQYTRNMLQINRSGEYFQEMGLYSGLAATDWSWSPLFVDLDLDGYQDVFIATGIPRRPNDLDYIKYVSNKQIQQKITTTKLVDQKALDMMPSGKVHNYILQGSKNLKFSDRSGRWLSRDSIISTGAAWGDLNNNGAMDIVTNNINHPATLYVNNSAGNSAYLKIKMNFTAPNTFGIGSKVISYQQGKVQVKQLYTTRGFQSSSEPVIHFGYGDLQRVDSLLLIWPDNTVERLYDIEVNQTLSLVPGKEREKVDYKKVFPKSAPLFSKVDSIPGIDYRHKENNYVDFNRQKLIPYKISNRGPATVVADLNGDGLDDIFLGGSKLNPSKIYFQTNKGFAAQDFNEILNDSITEDISAIAEDLNNNGNLDLFVVSGGGEFYGESKALLDRHYMNEGTTFSKKELPSYFENGMVVKAFDYDKDGYKDLFVGGGAVSNDFGKTPGSYLLRNNKGKFEIVQNEELKHIGMVTDAVWTDFDRDGHTDLIVVGEWMSPRFFRNENGNLKDRTSQFTKDGLHGLWQTIIPFDINGDGKMDYLLGNWGLNTKFRATVKEPLRMYYADFDGNGSTETIVAYAKNSKYYPAAGLDELVSQLSFLRKKFPAYKDFAGKTIEEIFEKEQLEKADLLTVQTLASGYLLNSGGTFTFKAFEAPLQVAPVTSFLVEDFTSDGKKEVLIAGNYFGVTPYHGNFSSLAGAMITSTGRIIEGDQLGLNLTQKSVRGMALIMIRGERFLMVTVNNDKPQFYKLGK
ncbi:hypothetical protein FK178_05955 [Antarcticibacterium arcticum]|uniref:ASPIC/UnbV domain-containing protein n=1 Tax=Antarcticibacterium arcticum TaxID=2585771 RepID=A0A5B8YHH1_9FLAO|nr:VCBS repeat-containing protein [Antarcticibacterium arcticum]QED37285.1 hypothetical protein FK178_05955 [Antarcticibacterium arcticum]